MDANLGIKAPDINFQIKLQQLIPSCSTGTWVNEEEWDNQADRPLQDIQVLLARTQKKLGKGESTIFLILFF